MPSFPSRRVDVLFFDTVRFSCSISIYVNTLVGDVVDSHRAHARTRARTRILMRSDFNNRLISPSFARVPSFSYSSPRLLFVCPRLFQVASRGEVRRVVQHYHRRERKTTPGQEKQMNSKPMVSSNKHQPIVVIDSICQRENNDRLCLAATRRRYRMRLLTPRRRCAHLHVNDCRVD